MRARTVSPSSLHVDMELADALGLHHVVVHVAHRLDGVGVVGGPSAVKNDTLAAELTPKTK